MYARFLKDNIEFFEGGSPTRLGKIFKKMAEELGNGRDNYKCRSHHQKMVSKYGTIPEIIESIYMNE